MKSKIEKTDEKIACLIHIFQENGTLSINDIQSHLSCNRQSVYNYLKRLEEKGCILKKYTEHNHIFYSLEPDETSELLRYKPVTLSVLRKDSILSQLQNGAVNPGALRHSFSLPGSDKDPDKQQSLLSLDISQTQFYNLINELLEDGEMEEKKTDKNISAYYPTGKNVPLNLTLNQDTLIRLNDILSNISKGNPYFNELNKLYRNTCILLGYLTEDMPYYDNYIIYGKKMTGRSQISENLKKITALDYKHKVLKITRKTRKGDDLSELIAVGKIIYSMEKDTFYLLGKCWFGQPHEMEDTTINVQRILNVSETDITHDYYDSELYQEIFDEMFGISTSEPCKVSVRFDNVANVKRKIEYLKNQRKKSELTAEPETNSIIYSDIIRGLPDFKMYLRKFGRSVHVLEPTSLKKEMEDSVEKTLARYELEENNE